MVALPTSIHLGVIGLGYVGLPLAASFAKRYPVTGFDINAHRIEELNQGVDRTLEVSSDELSAAKELTFSTDPDSLTDVNVYVVTRPVRRSGRRSRASSRGGVRPPW
ncbi:hypothetical protein [Janibacter alittae]|uniref:hypothetical protein n=1 Tax=Janibacter alittae TaxID=3115209 RepID=UPI003BAF583D